MLIAVASNSRALWYMTRGFGLVDLVLLTATLVMGITQVARFARPGLPRFVIAGLHKNISLLAVVFLAIHVLTAVADPFAPIGLAAIIFPFASPYRPLWLGLGALATDALVALVVTSLLRERLGYRTWKAIHWAAYACWPLAVVHGLGTGTDTKLGWVQFVYVVCTLAVLAALAWRLTTKWSPLPGNRRLGAATGALVLTVAVTAWTLQGPLRPGWARRSGTPPSLLGSTNPGTTSHGSAGGR
jgi:sulfoxide reductase heme-binding subunit YedZ